MNPVDMKEIVEALSVVGLLMCREHTDESNRLLRLANRIEQHGIAPPDGWVLVPKSIHPLDVDYGERAIELLANPPCAKRFNNSDDYYADWWAQLVTAAAPEVSNEP